MATAEDTSGLGPTAQNDADGPAGRGVLARSRALARDDRLAARAAKGDRHAFAELYRRHHQRLYRYCLSLVGDPEDAADALQTTMAKALTALEQGEAVRGVRPWLFRIAHNAAIDLVRSRRARTPLDEIDEIETSALTTPSAASEAQSRVALAEVVSDIRELPERQRSALVMRELSELSYAEIAAALDTSQLAARQLVHQARSRLHDQRDGRTMDCDTVRRGLGETDGRRPRDRQMRAHLAACQGCETFASSIRSRRSALAAFAPPLAPLAASDILAGLIESSSTQGGGVAAGGVTAGAAKLAGASAAAKIAGTAVVGAAAVAAVGGAVLVGGALLGPEDVDPSARAPGPARASLTPDLPALRPMPRPAAPRSPDRGRSPGESAPDGARSPAGPSGDGLPSAGLAQNGPPVDLQGARDGLEGARDGLKGTGEIGLAVPSDSPVGTVEVPGGSDLEVPDVDVPGGTSGSDVEVPDVEIPEVEIPDVGEEVPGGGSVDLPGDSDGSGVDVPDVEVPDSGPIDVPEPSVEVPEVSAVPDSDAVGPSDSAASQVSDL